MIARTRYTMLFRSAVSYLRVAMLAFFVVGLCACSVSLAADNPATWAVVGAKTFTPDQIRTALRRDWEVALMPCPGADPDALDDYCELLERKLLFGYQSAGFRDAKIVVDMIHQIPWSIADDSGATGDENDRRANDGGAPKISRYPHVFISIESEGIRFRQGEIHLVGGEQVDVDALMAMLKSPADTTPLEAFAGPAGVLRITDTSYGEWRDQVRAGQSQPIWKPGEPVPLCCHPSNVSLRDDVHAKVGIGIYRALAAQGFLFPDFAFKLVFDDPTATADLEIILNATGPKATLGAVHFTGLERHLEGTLREVLQLVPGEPLDQTRLIDIADRLWWSGRFVDFSVKLQAPAGQDSGAVLMIEVLEHDSVPRLGDPLSREAQALLRMMRWFDSSASADSDIELSVDGSAGELARLVVSPKNGVALAVSEGKDAAGEVPLLFAVVFDSKDLSYYGIERNIRCRLPLPWLPGQGVVTGSMTIAREPPPKPGDDGQPPVGAKPYMANVRFGLGIHSAAKGEIMRDGKCPMQASFSYEPCVILDMLYRDVDPFISDIELNEGDYQHRLVGAMDGGDRFVAQIDAKTGRLIQLAITLTEREEPTGEEEIGPLEKWAAGLPVERFILRFSEDGYDRLHQRILADAASAKDVFDADRPVASLMEVAMDEPWVRRLSERAGVDVGKFDQVRKAWVLGWGPAIDRAVSDVGRLLGFDVEEREELSIPLDPNSNFPIVPGDNLAMALLVPRLWSLVLFTHADELVPRESWPWRISRAVALLTNDRAQQAGPMVDQLVADRQTGPLCLLTMAMLSESTFPDAARQIASLGLMRTDLVRLRSDLGPLVDDRAIVGRFVLRAADTLRSLRGEQLETVIQSVPEEYRRTARGAVEELRRDKDRPLDAATIAALEVAWRQGLRTLVERELVRISGDGAAFYP